MLGPDSTIALPWVPGRTFLLSCPDSARRKLQHREGCCRRNEPHLILFCFTAPLRVM